MSVLKGKKILLGISGGIAAYKTASLVRLFIKSGAEVKVVMTPASKDFITPLTLSTLSKNPVFSDFYEDEDENPFWNNHVDLALWADLLIIAPATANTISKMANGNCDNLLLAVYLSAKCPVYFAPAMDLDMYKHPTTIANFHKLQLFGNHMIPAEKGELASGLSGEGRMAEPETILDFLEKDWQNKLPFKGKKILITAGPTYEPIDPVRFIGNHSSGKMGYAIANKAFEWGAQVTLVSGPSHLNVNHSEIDVQRVTTSSEMFEACKKYFESVDIVIAAAAVADYKPKEVSSQKIKKSALEIDLVLEKTTDILGYMGIHKKNQFLVGFALETENEFQNALQKIEKKNLDLIVLNSLNDTGSGFGTSTNKVTLITKSFEKEERPLQSKEAVAEDILNKIIQIYEV